MISTLEKIRRLEEYLALNNSNIDPIIETTVNKLLVREHNRMLELKTRLTNELSEFEKRYDLSSSDFYQQYEAGQLGDMMDYIEWAATLDMLTNVKRSLDLLEAANN
jgi:hypothetical protein